MATAYDMGLPIRKPCPMCGGFDIDLCHNGKLFGHNLPWYLQCAECGTIVGGAEMPGQLVAMWDLRNVNGKDE